jgi:mycothiol synthase
VATSRETRWTGGLRSRFTGMVTDIAVAGLPPGLTARPLRREDSREVFELIAACERHDLGTVEIEEADLVGDWGRPSFDLASSSVGVRDGDRLVAYAELTSDTRADAHVHPDVRRRGIGTALASWVRATARARGAAVVGSPVPQGSDGDRLLERLGYFVRWESWVLELPEGAAIEPQPLPPGHAIRDAATEEDQRAAWTVLEDAFLEWAERDREPFEDFAAEVMGRPGFEPWHLRLVVDGDGTPVGACHLVVFRGEGQVGGYVQSLAVRRDRRGQGLARALLADAFAGARRVGATTSELNTDTRTGALGLYERVGMRVRQTWLHRAYDLTGPEPEPTART